MSDFVWNLRHLLEVSKKSLDYVYIHCFSFISDQEVIVESEDSMGFIIVLDWAIQNGFEILLNQLGVELIPGVHQWDVKGDELAHELEDMILMAMIHQQAQVNLDDVDDLVGDLVSIQKVVLFWEEKALQVA